MVWDWNIDGWIVLIGALAACASAVLGVFLLLRRMSLVGDAISHAVLPGIAAAYLFTGERTSWVVFFGAAATGLITVWISEMIQRYGKVEASAAIGIVFTTMFALGLILIVRAGDHVDLDPMCILYGNLELVFLDTVTTPVGELPRVLFTLGGVLLLNLAVIFLFYKEWSITTFDPVYARSQGVPAEFFHYLLASLVAMTCVAAFEAVGNILVIAVIVVPAAMSFLVSKRLSTMLLLSLAVAAMIAVTGHLFAIWVPAAFGHRSINSAASMAVVAGLFLALTILFSPENGFLAKWWREQGIAKRILLDDVLAYLYRQQERRPDGIALATSLPAEEGWGDGERASVASKLRVRESKLQRAIEQLWRDNLVAKSSGGWVLTESGRKHAQNLVRSHRLWEQYLAIETNLPGDKVHTHAESWEHFTSPTMRGELDSVTGSSSTDPHGRTIPPES